MSKTRGAVYRHHTAGSLIAMLLLGALGWAGVPARARAQASAAPGDGAPAATTTPLHDLPISKVNRILLPLYDKWVSALLRGGKTVSGRLSDIRIRYVVIRTARGRAVRIQRRQLAQVQPARRPTTRVTAESVQPLRGRMVSLLKQDGTRLEGLVKSVSDTEVNLETTTSVVGVPLAEIKQVSVAKPAANPTSPAARLTRLIGRTVRLYRKDGSRVEGVLKKASEAQVEVESAVGMVTVPVEDVKRFLVGQPSAATRDGERGRDNAAAPVDRGSEPAAAGARPIRAHHYRDPSLADQAFREQLLKKYARIKRNGARLRNWGIGLMVAAAILEGIGTAVALSSKSDKAASFAYAMYGMGGIMFTPGLVMMIWGQVRHIRAIEWDHRLKMWRP